MSERNELIDRANSLALEFPGNISSAKLQAMIDEATGNVITSKPEKVETEKDLTPRQRIAQRKKEAFRTRVVTITNKDPRDSAVTNTAHLSFENNYFGLAKNVPLDVPVELEVSLIKIAAATLMPLHKREIVDGKATGNMVTVRVKKYAISYGEEEV